MKQLSSIYKEFVEINENCTNYKIKFLNLSNNFRDVLAISTGTSGINHLMEVYKNNLSNFNGSGKSFPVIIIIDNDDGSIEIKKKLNINKNDIIKSYYCFAENLYVLIIPRTKDKAIEDLFDSKTLSMKVDGKSFNRGKNIDTEKEYGKFVFAEKVIKVNQQRINFEGFKEVFERARLIIDDY